MKNSNLHLAPLLLLILAACSPGRQTQQTDKALVKNLQAHIGYLADDKLEGRRTGSNGEELAMNYIVKQYEAAGLQPKGTEYYVQNFIVNDGRKIDEITSFAINGKTLTLNKDFFPLAFSGDGQATDTVSLSVQEAMVPWFFDLKDILAENQSNPHFDLYDYVRTNSVKAGERGASAVILYNTSATDDKLGFDPKDKSEKLKIPVLYMKKDAAKQYLPDPTATITVAIRCGVSEKTRTGHNVIGYIDNKAPNTVVLGAHYDHLGYGEDGNSMLRTGEKLIHNGADDNASGTAALLELARLLKTAKAKQNYNYLFIAFSGEELGLFGSKYFTEHPTIDLKSVNYMINMDMVGRLNDSSRVITIGGYGTSPSWGEYYSAVSKGNPAFVYKYDSSGTGPSDHTSFYRKDIPVLFYFTGLHSDYHKPSDDADKINYAGEARIITDIYQLVQQMNMKPRLAFTKTRETQTTTAARFSVSMGIMPDYTFAGTGVKVDGVTEGKPAQKAGLAAGDVIIQLGDYNLTSLESYMQALGKFKKGDKTKVKFKRGAETLERTVEF